MVRSPLLPLFPLLALSTIACAAGTDNHVSSDSTTGQGAGGSGTGGAGGSAVSTGSAGGDTGTGGGAPSGETCGNGVDDDANGLIDDGCACQVGDTQKCYTGSAAQAGQGVCVWGMQACVTSGSAEVKTGKWGDCVGSGSPGAEVCGDAVDNDCNGMVDDGCNCAPPTVVIGGLDGPIACNAPTAQATLTFDKAVSGVVAGDTVVAAGGAVIAGIAGGPTVYTVDLASLAAGGAYGLSVLPMGQNGKILSTDCQSELAAPANANFGESSSGASLSIAPGPVFSFGGVPLNMTVEHTFTVTPSGGGVAGNVVPSLAAPFAWKGGAYPGVGGTCGASIGAPCTVVVTYDPVSTCTDFAQLSLSYATCDGVGDAGVFLSGHGQSAGDPTTCATTNVLYVSPSGNDANSGLAPNAPKKTLGAALLASMEGSEIRAAAGLYSEELTVTGCRKIFGGYDASFANHDPKMYVSTLSASVPNGGVISFPGAALHLDGFTVTNTAATGEALYYFQGSSVISNNVLTGADYGMYFWQHSCGAIHDNVLQGAQGGLYFWQSRIPVYNNRSTGVNAAVTTWQNQGLVFSHNDLEGGSSGIQTWQQQGMIFDGNRISGTSNGVDGWQSTGVVYRNNYLYGASAAITESSNLVIVSDNTIAGPSVGLSVGASDYVVANNVFLGTAGSATGIQGQTPSSIQNNLFLGLGTFVSVNGNPAVSTAAGVNALDGSSLGMPGGCMPNLTCWTLRAGGNIGTVLLPGAVFVSTGGPDASVASLGDDDWHLATNDPAITQGGKDSSLGDCGSHESPRSCGAVATDFAGLPRSVPYSIGAHEK